MNKLIIGSLSILLSGCTSLGDLQAWNSMGKSGAQVGQILRTADSTCKVLTGQSCDKQSINVAQINRTQSQIEHLPYHYRVGNIPKIIAETNEVIR